MPLYYGEFDRRCCCRRATLEITWLRACVQLLRRPQILTGITKIIEDRLVCARALSKNRAWRRHLERVPEIGPLSALLDPRTYLELGEVLLHHRGCEMSGFAVIWSFGSSEMSGTKCSQSHAVRLMQYKAGEQVLRMCRRCSYATEVVLNSVHHLVGHVIHGTP